MSHRVLMTVLPCDPVTSSHHPARSHCLTCTGSISRALDVPSSSREQSGTSATPSNYPHSKTSKAKLACAAAPSTDNARHLNRVFLLCQHFHCQPVQWPRQGGPTDPRPCQTDTPPAPALRISILKDIPPWFRGSHLRLWKAVTVSPARLCLAPISSQERLHDCLNTLPPYPLCLENSSLSSRSPSKRSPSWPMFLLSDSQSRQMQMHRPPPQTPELPMPRFESSP